MDNIEWIEWVKEKFYKAEELGCSDAYDDLFEEMNFWLPALLEELGYVD